MADILRPDRHRAQCQEGRSVASFRPNFFRRPASIATELQKVCVYHDQGLVSMEQVNIM